MKNYRFLVYSIGSIALVVLMVLLMAFLPRPAQAEDKLTYLCIKGYEYVHVEKGDGFDVIAAMSPVWVNGKQIRCNNNYDKDLTVAPSQSEVDRNSTQVSNLKSRLKSLNSIVVTIRGNGGMLSKKEIKQIKYYETEINKIKKEIQRLQ